VANADICAFYATHWQRPIALSRRDFVQWQMCAAPDALGRNRPVVALEGDQIIARRSLAAARRGAGGMMRAGG